MNVQINVHDFRRNDICRRYRYTVYTLSICINLYLSIRTFSPTSAHAVRMLRRHVLT